MKSARDYVSENANVAWQYRDWLRSGDLESAEQVAPGQGAVLRRGVRMIAAYRDPQGELHEMSAACTHLGCVVRWNSTEHTWDCKCHGSRFDARGKVLNGPAVVPLHAVDESPPRDAKLPKPEGAPHRPGPPAH
jgi:Rieske Fe-S protein